ncbi:Rv3235 family protein [Agrococcus sp. Marseille-P2731]|uniref:Rv3235 family protein n=1 Tax=Agrococcus sp. Marseille-P2731 TaxID=1841862 RepID=UPI000931156B|nr:Rv3235 family protein [Agrococcus sp. Marseille-P2731]
MTTVDAEEFFDFQPCSSADLPDPTPLLENLARGVIEILLGVREVQQIARWVTEQTFVMLTQRALSAKHARARQPQRTVPGFAITSVRACHTADGIVEGAVIVRSAGRTRAVAIRLEGLDGRWRATAIGVL